MLISKVYKYLDLILVLLIIVYAIWFLFKNPLKSFLKKFVSLVKYSNKNMPKITNNQIATDIQITNKATNNCSSFCGKCYKRCN